MTFYDKLVDNLDNFSEIEKLLISFDYMLENLHNNGFCIYDFNLKKINLVNDKLLFESFKNVINDIGIAPNMKELNIFQLAKIGLMAYNGQVVDGSMNQEYFNFIQDNFTSFNTNGHIPEDIFEYYGELFQRLNVIYLNDYIIKKQEQISGNQNSNVIKKSLSTEIGRAYVGDEKNNAYVNVLFIPSIITLAYLIGLIIYLFVIK